MLGGVVDQIPHLLGAVLFIQSAHGAGGDALTAVDAGHVVELQVPGRFDGSHKATVHSTDHANVLHLIAGGLLRKMWI